MHSCQRTISSVALSICIFSLCVSVQAQESTHEQSDKSEAAQTIAKAENTSEPKLELPGIKELTALGRPLNKLVPESVTEALKLRETFLADVETESRGKAIQRLSANFAVVFNRLEKDAEPVAFPSLFDFSTIDFESAIRGTESCPSATETFSPFTGKWYGRWAEMDVDHHWSRVIKSSEHSFTADFPDFQIGWQYAWIGDGYGVNHCARFTEQGKTKRFILGYTEHLQDGDFTKITARRPHVGIYAGPGKLIWITAREVFFEETHTDEDGQPDSYSIIGFNYAQETTRKGNNVLATHEGFVTRYSTDPTRRESFQRLLLGETVRTIELGPVASEKNVAK